MSSVVEPRRPTEAARMELARLPAVTPLAEVFARACEIAADAIAVARVGVWLFVDDRTALRCANLYERGTGEHSAGAILRVADFPTYFAAVNVRKAVPAEVAADDPRTAAMAAAYLNPLGITSLLDAGIFTETGLVGVVCHEHVGPPREWTTEARDFAGSVADLLAVRIQAAAAADLRAAFRTQEDRLAAVEKAEAVEQIAAGIAHDFRNLLSVVNGNADLLLGRSDLSPDARQLVEALRGASARGAGLANELLEFARPVGRPPAVHDLAAATAEFLPVLKAAVGVRHAIRYHPPGRVGSVLVDKGDYTRVLLNLVANARDALPRGGEIGVRVAPVRVGGDAYVMLEVTDHGAGMDEATRRRAFDPFFTTKKGGTGVGLAVVRRVVDRAGGAVQIESAPGRGTTVRAVFPRVGASTGGTQEMPALTAG